MEQHAGELALPSHRARFGTQKQPHVNSRKATFNPEVLVRDGKEGWQEEQRRNRKPGIQRLMRLDSVQVRNLYPSSE